MRHINRHWEMVAEYVSYIYAKPQRTFPDACFWTHNDVLMSNSWCCLDRSYTYHYPRCQLIHIQSQFWHPIHCKCWIKYFDELKVNVINKVFWLTMFSISNNVVKVSEEKDQARMDPHEGILQAVKVWIEATSQLLSTQSSLKGRSPQICTVRHESAEDSPFNWQQSWGNLPCLWCS